VDEVAGLSFVPPADEFDTHAEALQGLFGLIDLNLETTVREEKWVRMIEQNFHASVSALEPAGTICRGGGFKTSFLSPPCLSGFEA
jgi:hypothetical protein